LLFPVLLSTATLHPGLAVILHYTAGVGNLRLATHAKLTDDMIYTTIKLTSGTAANLFCACSDKIRQSHTRGSRDVYTTREQKAVRDSRKEIDKKFREFTFSVTREMFLLHASCCVSCFMEKGLAVDTTIFN
jgi:hypothetical protein